MHAFSDGARIDEVHVDLDPGIGFHQVEFGEDGVDAGQDAQSARACAYDRDMESLRLGGRGRFRNRCRRKDGLGRHPGVAVVRRTLRRRCAGRPLPHLHGCNLVTD